MSALAGCGLHLVLDQGVPRDAAAMIRAAGCDCTHVADVGMHRADDSAILAFAAEHRAVVVTLDADFHTLLAVTGAAGPSVIRFRIQGLNAPKLVRLLGATIGAFTTELAQGSALSSPIEFQRGLN